MPSKRRFIPITEAATVLRFNYSRTWNFALSGQLGELRREGSRLFVERTVVEKQAADAEDTVQPAK